MSLCWKSSVQCQKLKLTYVIWSGGLGGKFDGYFNWRFHCWSNFDSSINNKVSIYPDLERSDVQKEHDTKMTLFHLFGQLTYKLDLISSQLFRRAVYRLRPPKNNNNINDTANPTPAK